MKHRSFIVALSLSLVFSACREKIPELHPTADKPVTISLWYDATVTEAGSPPADWIAYKIIRAKFCINLELTMLPVNPPEKNVMVNAAAEGNYLPDMVVINREPLLNLIEKDLIMAVDDLYPLMPRRTEKMYNENSRRFATVKGKCYSF